MTHAKLSGFLTHLKGVKRSASGYIARCPAHDDKSPSLSIDEKDGKVLLHCHAGCSTAAICAMLDIELKDLFLDDSTQKRRSDLLGEIVAAYDYTDQEGNVLFQSVRFEPKNFRQRHMHNGRWVWGLNGQRRVVYRLHDIYDAGLVYIVEGEKDAETLWSMGFPATCNPMGAGKWRIEYNETFRHKSVVILQDADEPGRKHAEEIAAELYSIANGVKLVAPLPGAKDVTEFFENGGTPELFTDLVESTRPWHPEMQRPDREGGRNLQLEDAPAFALADAQASAISSGFQYVTLSELMDEPEEEHDYVWDRTLPVGGFSICSAKPKVGKSTLLRNLAVAVARGEPFLGRDTLKGKVIYLCLEEKRNEVRKHFEQMGALTDEIYIHTGKTPPNALLLLERDIAIIRPVLVIIDPLSRVLRVDDYNAYGAMSRGLEELIDLSRRANTHIAANHHDSKMERSGGDALLGSTALFGSVDCHIQVRKRGEDRRTVSTTQRYGDDLPETVITLDRETGIISTAGDLKSFTMKEIAEEIAAAIQPGESATEKEIKERIEGYSQGMISKALREMLQRGEIVREGEGRRKSPFVYSRPELGL